MLSNLAFSANIKKGFQALEIKDYFKAKKIMTKQLKYNTSPAGFALATIFSRNDNPFYNIDSAYRYVMIADSTWNFTKERKKQKWAIYGWTRSGIDSLKLQISSQLYQIAYQQNSVESYSRFLTRNPWSLEYDKALYSRDSLAFHQAVAINSSSSYKAFMDKYPTSSFYEIAKQNYFHSQFIELTGDGSLESYKEFVKKFPNSPLRYEADSMIYHFVTQANDFDAYKDFVENYATNKLIKKAWREFYQVFLFDYSKERMQEFLQLFPNNPIVKEIKEDILWYDSILLPFENNGLYGLMNSDGYPVVDARFSYIGAYVEGLFFYGENESIGIVNRKGQVIIPAEYDAINYLSKGRFVVEKNEMLGLVDRKGKELVPCELDDVGNFNNGLVYLSKNEKYYYANYNGVRVIDSSFIDAFDFRIDKAIVETEEGVGVINKKGEFIIDASYERLKWLNDTILSYTDFGKWGIISVSNDTILPAQYEYIDEFKEGFALCSNADTLFYINTNGENQFNRFFQTFPNYRVKGEFMNGTAIVYKNGRYGRINLTGDIITDLEFENLALGTKFIPFEEEELWGVMSLSNKEIVEPKYDRIQMVGEMYAITNIEDSLGLIDVKGNIVLSNKYKSITALNNNCFSISDGNSFGLFVENEFVTMIEFSIIELFSEDFVSLTSENGIWYYDLAEKRLIKPRIEVE